MKALELLHGRWVYERRVGALRDALCAALPSGPLSVLDVGCGDGLVDRLVMERRPEVTVEGIDVLVRPRTFVPVTPFDGRRIPRSDRSVDVVTFVDVLHHADEPRVLLAEAARVARRCVVVKDHLRDGPLAGPLLRFMDWVGNARHGVALPYRYWSTPEWRAALAEVGLAPALWRTDLSLYPPGLEAVFGGALHCLMRLDRAG